MTDVLSMLFGGGLVSVGILSSALADRIRGGRVSTREARAVRTPIVVESAPVLEPEPARKRTPVAAPPAATQSAANGADVIITALMNSGYKKPVATKAVFACTAFEQLSSETWLLAALRRASGGAA